MESDLGMDVSWETQEDRLAAPSLGTGQDRTGRRQEPQKHR